jgi:hypothetical protein
MDVLRTKNDDLQRKHNEIIIENERRMGIQDHLNEVNELKK